MMAAPVTSDTDQPRHQGCRARSAQQDRGVLLVLTGVGTTPGASDSTPQVGMVRFLEYRRPGSPPYQAGEFTSEPQRRNCESRLAIAAWQMALGMLSDPAIDVVVLDELNSALENGYVPLREVIEALGTRPSHQHVVISGRYLPSRSENVLGEL